MLKTEVKKLEKSEVEITVSIPWNEWKGSIEKAVKEISKEMKFPGFREGKAPRDVVEKKVGSGMILEEAANLAIQQHYGKVIEQEKIDAIGSPKAEIIKLEEENELEFKVTTSVMPEAKLGEWKKHIKKVNQDHKDKKVEVTKEEIEAEIEKLAQSRVKLVTVDREAKKDDNVLIDFEVKREGVPIEGGTAKNHPLVLGKGVFIPGFEENLEGKKAGEKVEFELSFPKDYHEKNLAGKPAEFSVLVNAVQERQTPEVNDDFAKSLGKFEKLEELKKSIEDGMKKEKEKQLQEQKRADYVEKLVEAIEVEIPNILIEEELSRMINEFEMQISGMGMTIDSYLERMGKKREDLERDWQPQAIKRIKGAMALDEVAKQEDIEVPADKVEQEMNKTLAMYKNVKDVEKNIDLGKLYNYTKGTLQNEETFKKLEEIQ